MRNQIGSTRGVLGATLALTMLWASGAGAATIETLLHPFTGDDAEVRIVLDDAGGQVEVRVEVTEGVGDIRGVFFNLANDVLLGGLTVTGADVTSFDVYDVQRQGGGNNLNGGGSPCPCDLGVEIGSPGIGKDDILSTTFWISHPDGIDLAAFRDQYVGVRLTSVGWDREGSSKLSGVVPEPSTAALLGLGLLGVSIRRRASARRSSR